MLKISPTQIKSTLYLRIPMTLVKFLDINTATEFELEFKNKGKTRLIYTRRNARQ